MDVDMCLSVQRPIPDGALGNDERTETQCSPTDEANKVALGLQRCSPGVGRLVQQDEQDMEEEAEGDSPDIDKRNRKNHRRGKNKGGKKHWKPYSKLTWEERQKADERETKRAFQRREKRFASGHPLAPYNTTQFLMDQHPVQEQVSDEPIENGSLAEHQNKEGTKCQLPCTAIDTSSASESCESPNNDIFLVKDFSETYDSLHAERLQDMDKGDLIRELIELESKLDHMERRMREQKISPCKEDLVSGNTYLEASSRQGLSELSALKMLVKALQDENILLREEIKRLRKESE